MCAFTGWLRTCGRVLPGGVLEECTDVEKEVNIVNRIAEADGVVRMIASEYSPQRLSTVAPCVSPFSVSPFLFWNHVCSMLGLTSICHKSPCDTQGRPSPICGESALAASPLDGLDLEVGANE